MKRIKDLLLSVFIFGSIVVIIFIIISFFNVKKTISLVSNETSEKEFESLKYRESMLEPSSCKSNLDTYITYVDKGLFDGFIKLKDLYNYYSEYPVLSLYNTINVSCNFTEEEVKTHNLPNKYTTIIGLCESLFNKYMFSYELNLKDTLRTQIEPNVDSLLYSSIRYNQVEILKSYLDILESREVIYE